MTQALVAVFPKQAEAQQACDALLREGFSRNNVRFASAESMGETSSAGGPQRHDDSMVQRLGKMCGIGKEDDTKTYSEAVRSGTCVLTVKVANDDEARRAEGLMERHNPMEISMMSGRPNGRRRLLAKRA